jgi:cold shock CspA family protein
MPLFAIQYEMRQFRMIQIDTEDPWEAHLVSEPAGHQLAWVDFTKGSGKPEPWSKGVPRPIGSKAGLGLVMSRLQGDRAEAGLRLVRPGTGQTIDLSFILERTSQPLCPVRARWAFPESKGDALPAGAALGPQKLVLFLQDPPRRQPGAGEALPAMDAPEAAVPPSAASAGGLGAFSEPQPGRIAPAGARAVESKSRTGRGNAWNPWSSRSLPPVRQQCSPDQPWVRSAPGSRPGAQPALEPSARSQAAMTGGPVPAEPEFLPAGFLVNHNVRTFRIQADGRKFRFSSPGAGTAPLELARGGILEVSATREALAQDSFSLHLTGEDHPLNATLGFAPDFTSGGHRFRVLAYEHGLTGTRAVDRNGIDLGAGEWLFVAGNRLEIQEASGAAPDSKARRDYAAVAAGTGSPKAEARAQVQSRPESRPSGAEPAAAGSIARPESKRAAASFSAPAAARTPKEGLVIFWHRAHWGRIQVGDRSGTYHVSGREILGKGRRNLAVGDRVSFEAGRDAKGLRAYGVQVLRPARKTPASGPKAGSGSPRDSGRASAPAAAPVRKQGRVIFWDIANWGRIEADDRSGTCYVNWREILGQGYRALDVGDTVSFESGKDAKGPRAFAVKLEPAGRASSPRIAGGP